jgi:hypothetical protein
MTNKFDFKINKIQFHLTYIIVFMTFKQQKINCIFKNKAILNLQKTHFANNIVNIL